MNDLPLAVGEKILVFRRRCGYSRKQLADIVGVTTQTIANYENGITLPNSDIILNLAEALNTNLDMLLFDPEAEKRRSNMRNPTLTQSQLKNMF